MRGKLGWLRCRRCRRCARCASCGKTVDSVGYNGVGGVHLNTVTGPATYPNPFKDLGKTDAEIAVKIADTFQKLFYGDPNLQAIYVPMGTDQAYIQDTLHGDIRTEGIGLAMMICIQLDKRAEFDRLWTYADTQMKQTGRRPAAGISNRGATR